MMVEKTWMLKSLIKSPPGGWQYTQKETELKLDGGSFETVAVRVLEHRIYKELDRATLIQVMEDIEQQTILRINHDSNFCTDKNLTNGKRDS